MPTLGLIPARYASSRFPGKPLVDIGGKTLLQRVYQQASLAQLDALYIATDDLRIARHAESFGAQVILTRADHPSGTDRCAEALDILQKQGQHFDLVLNIQGDEPFVQVTQIQALQTLLIQNPWASVSSLCRRIESLADLLRPDVVKAVRSANGRALYFSRAALPFRRDAPTEQWLDEGPYFRHLGLYGFRAELLPQLAALAPSQLEQAEQLEQLRWLEAGHALVLGQTTHQSLGVDRPEDVQACLDYLRNQNLD